MLKQGSEQTFRTLKRPFVYPDPYKIITDPYPDQGGPKTYGFYKSESVTLGIRKVCQREYVDFFIK